MSKPAPWTRPALLAVAAVVGIAATVGYRSHAAAETVPLPELPQRTHIHGIAVDPDDPSRLYLATHHGFFVASPEAGTATRVSETTDDFMGFTPHPTDPSLLYASGHPAGGGNLGVLVSRDEGRTWEPLAAGVGGPVDFHQMDVSRADPATLYGAYAGDLQVSRDAGRTWEVVGPAPAGLIDLAASAQDVGRLYAGTETGLLVSDDAGRSWRDAFMVRRPATMVETTADGTVYAFVTGTGLLRVGEPGTGWETLAADFGDRALLHLAADPTDPDRLYAVTHHGEVLASADAGRSWAPLGTAGAGG